MWTSTCFLSFIFIILSDCELSEMWKLVDVTVTAQVTQIPTCERSNRVPVVNGTVTPCDLKFVIDATMSNGKKLPQKSFRNQRDQHSMTSLNRATSLIYKQRLNVSRGTINLTISIFNYDQTNYHRNRDELMQQYVGIPVPESGSRSFESCGNDGNPRERSSNASCVYCISGDCGSQDMQASFTVTGHLISVNHTRYFGTIRLNLVTLESKSIILNTTYEFIIWDNKHILPEGWFRMVATSENYSSEAIYAEKFNSFESQTDVILNVNVYNSTFPDGVDVGMASFPLNFRAIDNNMTLAYGCDLLFRVEVRGLVNKQPAVCPWYTARFGVESFHYSKECPNGTKVGSHNDMDVWLQVTVEVEGGFKQMPFESHFTTLQAENMTKYELPLFSTNLTGLTQRDIKEVKVCFIVADDNSNGKKVFSPFFTGYTHKHQVVIKDEFCTTIRESRVNCQKLLLENLENSTCNETHDICILFSTHEDVCLNQQSDTTPGTGESQSSITCPVASTMSPALNTNGTNNDNDSDNFSREMMYSIIIVVIGTVLNIVILIIFCTVHHRRQKKQQEKRRNRDTDARKPQPATRRSKRSDEENRTQDTNSDRSHGLSEKSMTSDTVTTNTGKTLTMSTTLDLGPDTSTIKSIGHIFGKARQLQEAAATRKPKTEKDEPTTFNTNKLVTIDTDVPTKTPHEMNPKAEDWGSLKEEEGDISKLPIEIAKRILRHQRKASKE